MEAAQARTMSTLTPASAGVPGPGEMTMPSGPESETLRAEISSLRTTSTWHPWLSSRWARL